MSTCPQCGTTYPPQVSICTVDGTVLSSHGRATDPIVGTMIAGKYRIDAVLGRGGMGAVYRATHVMLNKTVAVKTINRDLIESAEMVQRFQREARAATSLEHPNIVAVYDLGQAEDGGLYIAMEFVKGVDLKDVIRASGPMPAARIVPLLTQVASALGRAHRNHIVHRDLKPQNLVIATDANGQERVKLLDFGIAKTLEEGATQLTADGYSLGTPHYMAPEQAMGEQVDGRADIYALGVILYEMLVGDVPFNAASAPAVLVKHMTEAPEPPSHRRPDLRIPPALEAVALRCLEKNPVNRFQTAEEFGAALERSVPAGAPGDAGVTSHGATVIVSGALTPPVAEVPRSDLEPATAARAAAAAPGNPLPPPGQTSAPPLPPPNPAQAPATKRILNSPGTSAAPTPTTQPAASGKGRLVPVLLAMAALFLVAIALGGYAAYRVWKSRPTITSERTSSEQAPAPVPAIVPDNPPPVSPVAAGGHDAETAAAAIAPPATPRVPADRSREANRAGGGAGATQASGAAARSTLGGPGQAPGQRASQIGVAGEVAGGTAAGPPAPALPKEPPVYFECSGVPDVCGALTTAFENVLERGGMTYAARPDGAEILVNARATLLETRDDQQFGTNFTVQTFSLELRAESSRDGTAIGMPAPKTFSFDRRFGRERAAEQGRVMAGEALERIQKFWTARIGG